jgi:hypothetical protein
MIWTTNLKHKIPGKNSVVTGSLSYIGSALHDTLWYTEYALLQIVTVWENKNVMTVLIKRKQLQRPAV